MKQIKIKILSFILAICLIMSASVGIAYADETTTVQQNQSTDIKADEVEEAKKKLEEQKAELEKKLQESEKLLASYSESAKVCEEYINALDEKIGYLNNELTILDSQLQIAQKNLDVLKPQLDALNLELSDLQNQYDKEKQELDKLTSKFETTYNAYCLRLRAMYISGGTSVISALLTCKDLSQFFSRYEMIKAISKSDSTLMSQVKKQIGNITQKQSEVNIKLTALTDKKKDFDDKQAQYDAESKVVQSKQSEIAQKKIVLFESRAESDELFGKYSQLTGLYTEYRNEDDEKINAVNKEIDDVINGLKAPDEVTTVDTSNHANGSNQNLSSGNALYLNSDAVLNMTYPAPNNYSVSQEFGHYRNGGTHTGIDYPCQVGSKIVAAQKGIVVTVKKLNYSYGYYVMIYHGTDSKGRKIVTLYAHNSAILVNVGQTVSKGQQIAKSGNTGNSTGPHCHFEIRVDNSCVNPKNYLSK